MNIQAQHLVEKWSPVLDHESMPKINDQWRRTVTAIMLENQESANREAQNANGGILVEHDTNTGAIQGYDPVLISMVRRSMPQLIAYDVMGVQPMTMPTGLIFAMRARYNDSNVPPMFDGEEALFNEADSAFSGAGTQAGTDPTAGGYTTGTGEVTSTAEQFGAGGQNPEIAEMGFSIEKVSVTARSRKLKAQYTVELAQDLKNVHGLDAESELANILSTEILAEINREAIRTLYIAASAGSQVDVATPGTFDLDVDSNGRWSAEKFKGLMFNIDRDANAVARATRRGKGNVMICSSDVASALQMAGVLDYAPAIQNNLEVDDAGSTFAGVANGRIRVYIDPYFNGVNNYYVIGYKGSNPFDAGMFYAPYVPLQMSRAMAEDSFQPRIAFMTRYGMTGNPFAYDEAVAGSRDQDREINPLGGAFTGNNTYYRKSRVLNIM
jgi:hypothetical protein